MQNRTEFLTTGLVPVTNTSELSDDGCPVCAGAFEDPVSLPCPGKHTFCKPCIVDWLKLPNRNSCPLCRHPCFALTVAAPGHVEVPARVVDPARTALMAQALNLSGLTNGEFSTFSDDISWHTSSIEQATASATAWLTQHGLSIARVIVDKRRLGPHIIAMANLLKGYARASGRPYNAQLNGEWRIIVDSLYREIARRHSASTSGMILGWELVEQVQVRLEAALNDQLAATTSTIPREAGLPRTSVFLSEDRVNESPAGDLHRLVAYVVFRASEEHARRQQQRQDIRAEPRLINRVGMRLHNVFHH